MALKKKYEDSEDEITIFGDALIYKRGEHWQMRMWLAKEGKYARFSLKTTNQASAIALAENKYIDIRADLNRPGF